MIKKICDVRPGDVIMYHDTIAIVVSKENVNGGYSYYQYKCVLSQINNFSGEVKFYAPYDRYAIINCLEI